MWKEDPRLTVVGMQELIVWRLLDPNKSGGGGVTWVKFGVGMTLKPFIHQYFDCDSGWHATYILRIMDNPPWQYFIWCNQLCLSWSILLFSKLIINNIYLFNNNNTKQKQCWGSTGQRFKVELTRTVTGGSPRTAKGTKYVTHHETACSTWHITRQRAVRDTSRDSVQSWTEGFDNTVNTVSWWHEQ